MRESNKKDSVTISKRTYNLIKICTYIFCFLLNIASLVIYIIKTIFQFTSKLILTVLSIKFLVRMIYPEYIADMQRHASSISTFNYSKGVLIIYLCIFGIYIAFNNFILKKAYIEDFKYNYAFFVDNLDGDITIKHKIDKTFVQVLKVKKENSIEAESLKWVITGMKYKIKTLEFQYGTNFVPLKLRVDSYSLNNKNIKSGRRK